MFKVYKYKKVSVFLLTFFVLTNGFGSSEEESEWFEDDNSGGKHLNMYSDYLFNQLVSDLDKLDQSQDISVENNNNNKKRKNDDSDKSEIEEEFSESEEQSGYTKKRTLKKNNSSKKRKVPIEKISEIEEEQSEEEKDQNLIKKAEKIRWTPKMVEFLKELKNEGE